MAFGSGLDTADDMVSEINMVPLIDVMMVLLIIFIITVPVLTHSVNLELPRASNRPSLAKPDTVTLSVDASGQLSWNSQNVDEAELERRLRTAAAQQPQPDLQIRGDRQVAYEHVIKTMAAAQRAGDLKAGIYHRAESLNLAVLFGVFAWRHDTSSALDLRQPPVKACFAQSAGLHASQRSA